MIGFLTLLDFFTCKRCRVFAELGPKIHGMGAIGPTQVILIVLVVLLLFGGRKIPELMRGLGRGVKEFKDATQEDGKGQNEDDKG